MGWPFHTTFQQDELCIEYFAVNEVVGRAAYRRIPAQRLTRNDGLDPGVHAAVEASHQRLKEYGKRADEKGGADERTK